MRMWTVPGYTTVGDADAGAVRAVHSATNVPVIIRYVPSPADSDDASLLRDGARRLADLDSPHVVGLYEYVESADGVATVRAFVDGIGVADLAAAGPLRPPAALTVLKGVLLGLTALHASGPRRYRFTAADALVARDGAVLVTAEPYTAAPTSAEPTSAEPMTAEPMTAEPVAEPNVAAPGTASPVSAEPDAAAPVSAEPDATEPVSAEPDAAEPHTPARDAAAAGRAEDVAVAYALFLECLTGSSKTSKDARSKDPLPKRLSPLAGPGTSGDGPGLLAALESAARAAHGADWETTGRTELTREVARRQRRTPSGQAIPRQRRAA